MSYLYLFYGCSSSLAHLPAASLLPFHALISFSDEGFLDPESNVYNFLSSPTLAIICQITRLVKLNNHKIVDDDN